MKNKKECIRWGETNRIIGALFFASTVALVFMELTLEINLTSLIVLCSFISVCNLINYRYVGLRTSK